MLCRPYIALLAACSTATGFILFSYHRVPALLMATTAVLLLACGALALNQYQERDVDAKMDRTRRRPLPSGAISPSRARCFSVALLVAGQLLLADAGGAQAFVLGLAALLWYNGIYTYLKRVTAFAAVPGAIVGMVPPAIGWVTSGGALFDPRLAALCFIFFMWQVPHFWLLILRHGGEYEAAGLPSLTSRMSLTQISRITFTWISAATIAGLALPLYGSIRSPLIYLFFIPLTVWIIWGERSLAVEKSLPVCTSLLFRKINLYLFLFMSLVMLDSIIPMVP
jgi:heme o synthase